MKTYKFIFLMSMLAIIIPLVSSESVAIANKSANPTCVLMKFTDDTRYDSIESADFLSELVMEKMIASGRFNLKETKPIDKNIENILYDEKIRDLNLIEEGMASGSFDELFEGSGFKEDKAQSIATASIGQFVSPNITSDIGESHGASYLVQGTIINLGTGNWWNEDFSAMSLTINLMSSFATAPIASALSGVLGPLSGFLSDGVNIYQTGIGVQSDIRIIKADTGEVIWSKRVIGIHQQKQLDFGIVQIGHSKLSSEIYAKAMNKAAEKIVNAMIADMDANKLFVK